MSELQRELFWLPGLTEERQCTTLWTNDRQLQLWNVMDMFYFFKTLFVMGASPNWTYFSEYVLRDTNRTTNKPKFRAILYPPPLSLETGDETTVICSPLPQPTLCLSYKLPSTEHSAIKSSMSFSLFIIGWRYCVLYNLSSTPSHQFGFRSIT